MCYRRRRILDQSTAQCLVLEPHYLQDTLHLSINTELNTIIHCSKPIRIDWLFFQQQKQNKRSICHTAHISSSHQKTRSSNECYKYQNVCLFNIYLFTSIHSILFCTFLSEIEILEIFTTKTWCNGGIKENDP